MLTYNFSTREKVMLAILAFVGIAVAWYQLVFLNIQNQISAIDSQIIEAQDQYTANRATVGQLQNMQRTIEEYQAQGLEAVLMPSFDNTQNLMAFLYGLLGSTQKYNMSFDTPELSDEDGTVHRTGTISFSVGSYAEARAIIESIAHGPYTCEVTSFGITDNTVKGEKADATVDGSLEVTFFEKATSKASASKSEDSGVQGNDLSQVGEMMNSL